MSDVLRKDLDDALSRELAAGGHKGSQTDDD